MKVWMGRLLIPLIWLAAISPVSAQVVTSNGGGGGGAVTQSGTWVITGTSASISVTPTVTASAYTIGYVVGGLQTLTGFARSSSLAAYLQNVTVSSLSGQTAPMYILVFNANPTSSTITDHAALAINSADVPKIAGVVPISNWYSTGTGTAGFVGNLVDNITPATGTSIYAVAVTQGTPTPGSTTDFTFLYGVTQN